MTTAVLQRVSRPRARGAAVAAAVGVVLFFISYDGGSYALDSYATLAILVWWLVALLIAFDLAGPLEITRFTITAGLGLTGFVAWSLASTGWAPSAQHGFEIADRPLLYLGVFLFVSICFVPRYAGGWCDGVAIGIAVIGLVALGTRFFPGVFHTSAAYALLPPSQSRLSAPIGYWNGLAVFCSLALPLFIRSALTKTGAIERGCWLVPFPAMLVTIYLTSSRGGAAAAALGILVFVLLVDRRVEALGALVVAGLASAIAIKLVSRYGVLVNTPPEASTGSRHAAALVVFCACIAGGVVYTGALLLLRGRVRVHPRLQLGAAVGVVALVIAAVAASSPAERLRSFKELPTNLSLGSNYVQNHLLSSSGNGRWQLWTEALHQFEQRPAAGGGAGSYGSYWLQHRPFGLFVLDAHSLYLQTLGELGLVGLVLLLVFLGPCVWGGAAWLSARPAGNERVAVAALTATLLAYLLAAGIDWMWELPAVTLPAIVVMAILCRSAAGTARVWSHPGGFVRASAVVLALAVIFCQAVPLLTERYVAKSQAAEGRGNLGAAVDAALQARSVAPWASTPALQLGLLAEEAGEFGAARMWLQRAIDRDTREWSYWLVAARIDTERGKIAEAERELAAARRLNPIGVGQIAPR